MNLNRQRDTQLVMIISNKVLKKDNSVNMYAIVNTSFLMVIV
jgi:hypothetical protein